MSEVKIGGEPIAAPPQTAPAEPETFSHTLPDGSVVVCGKPRGVLKLRLRNILTKDLLEDKEMVNIATALLSIRTISGQPVWLQQPNHFEALLSRFGDDAGLDAFMGEFNRLVNPELMNALESAIKEAEEKGIVRPDKIEEFIQTKVLEAQKEQRKKIRD